MTEQTDLSPGRMDAEIARLQVLNRLENQFAFALAGMFDEQNREPHPEGSSLRVRETIKRYLLDLMSRRQRTIQ